MYCTPLLLLALLLATPAAAQRTEILTRTLTTTPTGPRTPPSDMDVLPVINGNPVWPGSSECPPRTDHAYVPTARRADAIRYFTRRVLELDLDTKALTTPLSYETWRLVISLDFGQKFLDRPLYGTYAVPPGYEPNCGAFLCVCAAGVGTLVPQIDTSDPPRVEALVAWETVNSYLGLLNRADLWDGPYVGSVTRRVEQWLGGWKQE